MEIVIGKTSGFCFGVANAVNKTNKVLEENNSIFCLGELVHNKQVTDDLQNKGLKIIDNIQDARESVIIRAHGATEKTYNEAKKMGLNVIDLSCPKVLKIHDIAKEYSKDGYYIFLIGNKSHPESVATISYCGINSKIIQNKEEVKQAILDLYNSKSNKLLVIVQTTFNLEKFEEIVLEIEEKIKENEDITLEVKNTICDATKKRQNETEELSSKVDMMIIIGGKNSSNTNKLYEISKEKCKNSVLIEKAEELNLEEIRKYNKIGIMAGASTPKESIEAVVEKLNKIC